MKFQKAFTLIELLVVISIIGLLASIVLVSLEGGEDRAIVGKAMEFSHTVRVSLGSDLVGEWKLDETSGTTAKDSSGSGDNGTLLPVGSEPLRVDGVFGKALQFNGTNGYVEASNNFSFDTSKSGYTVSAWIYQISGNGYSWNSVAGAGLDGARFGLMTQGGTKIGAWACGYYGNGPTVKNLENKWHYIIAVYPQNETGFTPVKMYFDAEYVGDSVFGRSSPCVNSGRIQIAKSYGGYSTWFNGKVDEVQIYNRALSMAEIQQLYAEGASRHLTLR